MSSSTSWRSTMSERVGLFSPPKHPVLSLAVQAESVTTLHERSQFEILVRHILNRFFNNELLASDDETKRVMQIACAIALPTLLVSLFLFPAYHAFPPAPLHRPFWPQVGDHYFYVMYSFIVMGAATVYEWDLLFPDILDIFVLSILPVPNRQLFFARVLALAIFLCLVQIGTSILGTLFFPLVAEQTNFPRHLFAHFIAVTMSGMFAAACFLSIQGVLLNTVGERIFRQITPLLQGASIMLLLAVLLLCPTIAGSVEPLLTSGSPAIHYFPPFWFLGVYECLFVGASAPAIFHVLARTGCDALLLLLACTVLTYPLAYRRRVRQLIEGTAAAGTASRTSGWIRRLLHGTILRHPSKRAIFHFISQTILRSQRQRVTLAMFGGLSVALALAQMVILRVEPGHIYPALLTSGIRSAIPIMVFFTVVGFRAVLSAPVDRRGSWLFGVLIGRPRSHHLAGTSIWITLWALVVSLGTALLLHTLSPASLKIPNIAIGQLLVAAGLSFLLSDILLFSVRTIPFTHLHRGSVNDLPLAIFRYFVLFPIFVSIVVYKENWIESSTTHLCATLLAFIAAHLLLRRAHAHFLAQSTLDMPPDETEEFPQRLGLRDS
jgi:hypothetical protein